MHPTADAAQSPFGSGTDAVAPAPAPSYPNAGDSPTALTKEERDRLAAQGRELAAARRQAADADARANAALQQSQALADRFRQQDQANAQAYVNQLPPDQRAAAAVELSLRQEIEGLRQDVVRATAPPPPRPRMTQADIEERKAELRAQVAQETGIQLHGNEVGVDDQHGQDAYFASLRAVALQAQQQGAQAPQQRSVQTTGFPISPRPMPGAYVTSEALEKAGWRHKSNRPWETRKTFSDLRDAALRQAGIE